MARILVVDGDAMVSTQISRAMRSKGWLVDITDNGPTAVELAMTDRYRLIILDLDLPRPAGLRILREVLAAKSDQRVIVLCGASAGEDGIEALALGASDYLTRPFSVDELMARVLARLQESSPGDSGWYLHGAGSTLDMARRTVTTRQGEFRLTQRECFLLAHLMSDQARVFTRQELLADVWGDTPNAASNVVDVCVRRLRAKLGDDLIETVRSVGYTFRTN